MISYFNEMKTEADKLRNSIQYGLGVMDSGSGEFKELSNKIDELFELSYLEGQSSPKIKQLEWVEVWEGYEDAKTPFGHYVVRPSIDNKESLMVNLRKIIQPYSTLSEAKSAAQKDFERRVKECLDLKAQQKQALIDTMRGDEQIGLYDDNSKNHGHER